MSRRDHADMLKLPRPISRHPRMSMRDRAAQFAPFSALSGYQEIIASSARYRETRKTLAPDHQAHLDLVMRQLCRCEGPAVRVTYFLADRQGQGGSVCILQGKVRRIDQEKRVIVMADGTAIAFADIEELEILQREDAHRERSGKI